MQRSFSPIERERAFDPDVWSMIEEGARYLQPCHEGALMQHVVLAHPQIFQNVMESRPAIVARLKQDPESGMADLVSDVDWLWHQWRWRRGGRVIYEVDPLLLAAFSETDARLSVADVPVPYSAMFIAAPAGLPLGVEGAFVDGWYVTEMDAQSSGTTIVIGGKTIAVSHTAAKGPLPNAATNVRSLRVLATSSVLEGGPVQAFFLPLEGAQSVDDWANGEVSRGALASAADASRIPIWARIVAHTLLYVSSVDADVEQVDLINERPPSAGEAPTSLRSDIPVRYFQVELNRFAVGESPYC